MSIERNIGTSIFNLVGFEVKDAGGTIHKHYYREYHLLTPIFKSIPFEQLVALEILRRNLE